MDPHPQEIAITEENYKENNHLKSVISQGIKQMKRYLLRKSIKPH